MCHAHKKMHFEDVDFEYVRLKRQEIHNHFVHHALDREDNERHFKTDLAEKEAKYDYELKISKSSAKKEDVDCTDLEKITFRFQDPPVTLLVNDFTIFRSYLRSIMKPTQWLGSSLSTQREVP